MSWAELEKAAPEMARLGRRLLMRPGVAFLGTIRADGSPRVHPVSPFIYESQLMLGIIDRSPKSRDLRRDSRCVLHALPGPAHAEFWVEAEASPLSSAAARDLVERAPQFALPPGDTFFRLVLLAAHATIFQPGEDDRPLPNRRHWRSSATDSIADSARSADLAGAVTRRDHA